MDKPILSKQAFWDVDMDKIGYEKNAELQENKSFFHRNRHIMMIPLLN